MDGRTGDLTDPDFVRAAVRVRPAAAAVAASKNCAKTTHGAKSQTHPSALAAAVTRCVTELTAPPSASMPIAHIFVPSEELPLASETRPHPASRVVPRF